MGSVGIGGISGAARDALHPPTTSNQILLDLLEDILDYKYLDFLDSRKCNISTHYFKPDFVEDILDCNHQPFALKIFCIYYKYKEPFYKRSFYTYFVCYVLQDVRNINYYVTA